MITMKDLIKAFGIKNPTEKVRKHPKMKQILAYCNEKEVDIYEHFEDINEDAFCILLDHIHSIETFLQIINHTGVFLSINFHPKEIACFYNLYRPEIPYSEYANILLDPEYLTYASKEWTENLIFHQQKVLSISNQKLSVRKNPHDPEDEDYIDSYLLNLISLNEAKNLHLLKEAIEKLSV